MGGARGRAPDALGDGTHGHADCGRPGQRRDRHSRTCRRRGPTRAWYFFQPLALR